VGPGDGRGDGLPLVWASNIFGDANGYCFGIPWMQPRELTLSFAPDQTQVTTGKSSLFQSLNAQYWSLMR
jgi:hypothetical protein